MIKDIKLTPIEPFGAEIDIDLRQPIDEATAAALRDAFHQHHLLLFRGQELTHEQQQAVIAHFGPVLPPEKEFAMVSNVDPRGSLGKAALGLHSDLSYTADPYLGISLFAVDVDDGNTSTFFQDNTRAYYRLSDDMKDRLKDLKVRMVFTSYLTKRNTYDPALPSHIHPLISTNPGSGQPILNINQLHAAEIMGMPADKSEALLDELLVEAQHENTYEHKWYKGDLVFWDNRTIVHGRGEVSDKPRTLNRVLMARSGPRDLNPDFEIAALDYSDGGTLKLRRSSDENGAPPAV